MCRGGGGGGGYVGLGGLDAANLYIVHTPICWCCREDYIGATYVHMSAHLYSGFFAIVSSTVWLLHVPSALILYIIHTCILPRI